MINTKFHIVAHQLVLCREGGRKIQITARGVGNALDLSLGGEFWEGCLFCY